MKSVWENGIVLRIFPYGEYDAMVSFLAEFSGKKTLFARGLRKPQSKLCGLFQPLTRLEVQYRPPKMGSTLFPLMSAVLKKAPPPSHPALFFFSEVADFFSQENHAAPDFFQLLRDFSPPFSLERRPAIFFLKTLTVFGLLAPLSHCGCCHKKFSESARWQENGELYCIKCARSGEFISFSEIKMLSFWQQNSIKRAEKVAASPLSLGKIFRFLCLFAQRTHGFRGKSIALLGGQ